jgi:hypothetical protein
MTDRFSVHALRLLAVLACFFATAANAQVASEETAAAHALDTSSEMVAALLQRPRVDFKQESPRPEARSWAERVLVLEDNERKPFAIVDKVAAKVYVFDPEGRLIGAAPALLGIAIGDHSVPGIGTMELSAIRPQDRTTPSGRFDAGLGRNFHGKEILWIDYDLALSMHPVINTNKAERRPQRLASATVQDNRISFGCINVPIPFFADVVSRAFKVTGGVVYILPELAANQAQSLLKSPAPTARNTAAR